MNSQEVTKTLPGEPENIYGGFWIRYLALLIDGLIWWLFLHLPIYLNLTSKTFYYSSILPNILLEIWFYVFLVQKYGGTPGKLIMGIKVVKLDGQKATWREAILRHSVLFTLNAITSVLVFIQIVKSDATHLAYAEGQEADKYLSSAYPVIYSIVQWATYIWIFSELIILLTNDRRRAAHDFIAGTVVMKSKYIDIKSRSGSASE
jgi:uncharacterized RDD family membrane protein YckC